MGDIGIFSTARELLSMISIQNIIDIAIVAFIAYKLISWISGTQAAEVAKGVVLLLLVTQLASLLGLVTLNYILRSVLTIGVVLIVVLFQPELRAFLSRLGRTSFKENSFIRKIFALSENNFVPVEIIEEVTKACVEMGKARCGALIVLERASSLASIVDTGVLLDAQISAELLTNIFVQNTPLHDGAAVISREHHRIMAAGCLLPLTQNKNLRKELGTRHRAGLGISEVSDAVAVIVSEETGTISLAANGSLSRFLNAETLKEQLTEYLTQRESTVYADGFRRFGSDDEKKEKK